jgi:nucleotide-binding universal stress UspA family protein
MAQEERNSTRNILIAVDESENARRAILYVGRLLGGLPGFKVTLLHVVSEPEEDYFLSVSEREKWLSRHKQIVDAMLEDYRNILTASGFDREDVSVRSTSRYCPSVAECILAETDPLQYSTLVVGRRGLSKGEEFLFGSISSKIVNHARNCTIWVVE